MKPNIKGIAMLLSKDPHEPAAPADDSDSKSDSYEASDGEKKAGQDILDAIDSKDSDGLASAICNLIDIHGGSKEESPEESPDEEAQQ